MHDPHAPTGGAISVAGLLTLTVAIAALLWWWL